MSNGHPTLHLLCGKIASGKSTLAAELGRLERTVVVAEDAWLNALFADQLHSISDYVRCSSKLRGIMGPHIASLLNEGLSVVLDFAANTVDQRAWMRGIIDATGVYHQLHVLETPDEVCLARLRERNARGDHPFAVTDAQFHQVSTYFVRPSPEEEFNVVEYPGGG